MEAGPSWGKKEGLVAEYRLSWDSGPAEGTGMLLLRCLPAPLRVPQPPLLLLLLLLRSSRLPKPSLLDRSMEEVRSVAVAVPDDRGRSASVRFKGEGGSEAALVSECRGFRRGSAAT